MRASRGSRTARCCRAARAVGGAKVEQPDRSSVFRAEWERLGDGLHDADLTRVTFLLFFFFPPAEDLSGDRVSSSSSSSFVLLRSSWMVSFLFLAPRCSSVFFSRFQHLSSGDMSRSNWIKYVQCLFFCVEILLFARFFKARMYSYVNFGGNVFNYGSFWA